MAAIIDGTDGSWRLPLPPFTPEDVEPVSAAIDPGEEAARHEAAFRLLQNLPAVVKFALRGCGSPGAKRFQVRPGECVSGLTFFHCGAQKYDSVVHVVSQPSCNRLQQLSALTAASNCNRHALMMLINAARNRPPPAALPMRPNIARRPKFLPTSYMSAPSR